jgi:hypothetical protein
MVKDHRGTRRGHSWFADLCARFGLGHPHYRKRETRELGQAVEAGASAAAIAGYISGYISSADPNQPWPWRPHQRTLSAVRGALPPLPRSEEWRWRGATVAQAAETAYSEACGTCNQQNPLALPADAAYFNATTGEIRCLPLEAISASPSRTPVEGARQISEGRSGRSNPVPDAATARVAGPRDDHSAIARRPARHAVCSGSLDKERGISARRVRPRWENTPASAVLLPRSCSAPEKPPDGT